MVRWAITSHKSRMTHYFHSLHKKDRSWQANEVQACPENTKGPLPGIMMIQNNLQVACGAASVRSDVFGISEQKVEQFFAEETMACSTQEELQDASVSLEKIKAA